MKQIISLILGALLLVSIAGCASDADVVSGNLSKAADQFEIPRRIVFYNGITGDYMLTIEGYCSLGNFDSAGELSVTCEVADGQYVKDFLGLSDNVTYFAEQLDPAKVSKGQYRVVFKPSSLIPAPDVR